jgi:hypothetical protein
MNAYERDTLVGRLRNAGWSLRDGLMYAPRETMYLDPQEPWQGDWRALRASMLSRQARIRRNVDTSEGTRRAEFEKALADVTDLLDLLEPEP